MVEYGQAARNLSLEDRDTLLTQMLIQLRCPKIHIINATEVLSWMLAHQTLVEHNFKITVSLFCHGLIVDTNGEGVWDIADPFVTRVYPLINKFYTDNTAVIDYLVKKEGYDKDKFIVHYQPTPTPEDVPKSNSQKKQNGPLKVLWAGRISLQKNPKLLVRIAKKLNPEEVRIDAYGRIDKQEQDGFEFPEDVLALHYRGPFDSFAELNPADYDLFLHTSIIDGMPNVVLEAASYGLVTLAGNTGGVGDFVKTGITGFLVEDAENEDQYIKLLNDIKQKPETLASMAKEAQKLLKTQYGWGSFKKSIKRDFE